MKLSLLLPAVCVLLLTAAAQNPDFDPDDVVRDVRSRRATSWFDGTEFMVDTSIIYVPTPEQQTAPAVAFDGTDYLVVWEDYREDVDIYGARVTPAGIVLDREGIEISSAANSQESPSVAFDGANFLVVWDDTRNGALDDVYGARVSPAGVVLDRNGIAISTSNRQQYAPSVAFDGTDYLVAWTDSRAGTGEFDVYGARVSPAGLVRDTAGIPIATGAQVSVYPAVAWDGANCLVVWQSGITSGFSDIRGARVSPAGTVLDTAGIAVSTADSAQVSPAVAFDGANYLVVWEDERSGPAADIYGARVSTAGSVLDPAGIVVSPADLWQGAPSVAFDGTNYLIAWDDLRGSASTDVYAARLSRDGVLLDPTGLVVSGAANAQTTPALACDGTNCLAVWKDVRSITSADIYGARIGPSGVVLDSIGIAVTATVNVQYYPAVAFDGTNYLVAWADDRNGDYDIYGARISEAGAVLDPAALAISTADGDQGAPVLGFDGANYLVAWEDERSGNYSDVYCARVAPNGSVLDPAGIAVSSKGNLQEAPAVAFDGANHLVVWQDFRDASNYKIYGARVTPAGSVLDTAGIPISVLATYQYAPGVAFDGSNYLVAWMDHRIDQYYDIYGARVSPAGAVLDPDGMVISNAVYSQRYPSIACDGANCLVVWDDNSSGRANIHGARVSPAGVVLDSGGFALWASLQQQMMPKVAFDSAGWLAVWHDERGADQDIYGARVNASGTTVDSFVVSTQSNDQWWPAVACGTGGNALAAYVSQTDTLFGKVYDAFRVWARPAPFPGIGIAEDRAAPGFACHHPAATIIRGVLFLSAPTFALHSSLFSPSGQMVLDLHPGPNDVSRLAPGVYFVGQASGVERAVSTVTKVIISR